MLTVLQRSETVRHAVGVLDALLDPQSRHHAIPNRHEAADVPGVIGHQSVVLLNGGCRTVPRLGLGCDAPAPDRVVTQPQATDPDAVVHRAPAISTVASVLTLLLVALLENAGRRSAEAAQESSMSSPRR